MSTFNTKKKDKEFQHGVKLKVVSPYIFFFLRFMIFPTFLEISAGGGGGQKEKCFFLVNQFFLIMLSLRFMLFSKNKTKSGGGGSLRIRPSYSDDTFDCQYSSV